MEKVAQLWDAITDRFKHPLLGSFLISWALINYKAIVVILSLDHYVTKFAYLEGQLYAPGTYPWIRLFVLPLLGAAFYVFLLPAISLISTLTNGWYENRHNKLRNQALKKATLSTEQSEALQKQTADLLNKFEQESLAVKTARLEAAKITTQRVERLFQLVAHSVFLKLQIDAPNWSTETVLPEPGRTIDGTPEQEAFVVKFGIPKLWTRVFESSEDHPISTESLAKRLDLSEAKAEEILVSLSALGLLRFGWVDNAPYFHLAGGRWGALLNGRPA